MERLAECAGLSKAGIYAHFKSKEEIFHALLERTTKQICDFQGWLPDEDLTLPELVDVYLDRLYATFSSPATMSIYRLLLAESARTPELVQRWHNEVAHGLKERAQTIIHRNIRTGHHSPRRLDRTLLPVGARAAVLWLSSSMLSRAVLPSRWCSYRMRTGNCCLSFCSLNEQVMHIVLRALAGLAIGFVVLLLTVWGALALWHQMPQLRWCDGSSLAVVCSGCDRRLVAGRLAWDAIATSPDSHL
jgi:AcrR family transcriptional regulator